MLTNRQARLIDPVLSTHAQGYRQRMLVGEILFPRVPVSARGGQVLTFGKESFQAYNLRRAPGGTIKRVERGFAGSPFSLFEDSVEMPIPVQHSEDAQRVLGINLQGQTVNAAMDILLLSLEREQAALATTAANYGSDYKITLAGTSKWSHADAKPGQQVRGGREAVRAATGADPNVLVVGAVAWNALIENPSVIERFKYVSKDSITPDMIANLLELDKVVVGKAVKANDAGTMSDVWGNFGVLAYVPPVESQSMAEPSYGYTYVLAGNPRVEQIYYEKSTTSNIVPAFFERQPVLTGIESGYLFIAPN